MPNSFKTRLKALPLSNKMILFGSFLALISVFLPWYRDIDKFKTGDMFLGITGPMYLAGIIVMVSAFASFGIIGLSLFQRPVPKLPIEENHFHIFGSSVSTLMLVVAVSAFFHPKFGINLTTKNAKIGLILSFIGVGLTMLGAILSIKQKDVEFESGVEAHADPLINIEPDDRVQADLNNDTKVYDHGSMAVKNAVQESIGEFTNDIQNTTDLR